MRQAAPFFLLRPSGNSNNQMSVVFVFFFCFFFFPSLFILLHLDVSFTKLQQTKKHKIEIPGARLVNHGRYKVGDVSKGWAPTRHSATLHGMCVCRDERPSWSSVQYLNSWSPFFSYQSIKHGSVILCILEDVDDDVVRRLVPHLYSLNGKTKNNNKIKRLKIEIGGVKKKRKRSKWRWMSCRRPTTKLKTKQTWVPQEKTRHTHKAHRQRETHTRGHREIEKERHRTSYPYIDFPYVYASYYVFDGAEQQYERQRSTYPDTFQLGFLFLTFCLCFSSKNFFRDHRPSLTCSVFCFVCVSFFFWKMVFCSKYFLFFLFFRHHLSSFFCMS